MNKLLLIVLMALPIQTIATNPAAGMLVKFVALVNGQPAFRPVSWVITDQNGNQLQDSRWSWSTELQQGAYLVTAKLGEQVQILTVELSTPRLIKMNFRGEDK